MTAATQPACSFCGRFKCAVRKMLGGLRGQICDQCIRKFADGGGFVATCHKCTPKNGVHEVSCPEQP